MSKKAFTLIEVIITIIIVGVLSTLAFSQLIKVIHAQSYRTINSDLKTFRAIFDIYYTRHGKESLPGYSPMPAGFRFFCKTRI